MATIFTWPIFLASRTAVAAPEPPAACGLVFGEQHLARAACGIPAPEELSVGRGDRPRGLDARDARAHLVLQELADPRGIERLAPLREAVAAIAHGVQCRAECAQHPGRFPDGAAAHAERLRELLA